VCGTGARATAIALAPPLKLYQWRTRAMAIVL